MCLAIREDPDPKWTFAVYEGAHPAKSMRNRGLNASKEQSLQVVGYRVLSHVHLALAMDAVAIPGPAMRTGRLWAAKSVDRQPPRRSRLVLVPPGTELIC